MTVRRRQAGRKKEGCQNGVQLVKVGRKMQDVDVRQAAPDARRITLGAGP